MQRTAIKYILILLSNLHIKKFTKFIFSILLGTLVSACSGSVSSNRNISENSDSNLTGNTSFDLELVKNSQHYQNPKSSDNAQLEGDLTNWGTDESKMDKAKMNSLIITAYPTTVTGHNHGEVTNINDLSTDAKSGDVAQIAEKKYIFSGLENKWVKGYDLNNKNTTSAYEYLLPLRTIVEQAIKNGGATLYLPKGKYENQIRFSQIYNNTPPDFLTNFRIIGDGESESIIDTSYLSDSSQIHFENTAISISADNEHMLGLKNIIISDLGIKTYGQAIDIYSHTKAIGDNILVKNINIIKTSQNYYSLISFNRSLLMRLSRVTLDNVNTSVENDAYCMHELAFFKGKYIKIHNCTFNGNPAEYNIDTHTQFTEITNSKLIKTKSSGRPNIKFPSSNYILFNKVHFKSLSEREGNIMVSSSPEKYNLHFENCTFETQSPAIFTSYGHIGYGVKQLVLKNNKIIGVPTEFQIYGADKVYLKGNTKDGQAVDTILPYTYDKYHLPTTDFKALNTIIKTVKSGAPIDNFIGYKSWNNNNTNNVIRDLTLMNTEVSIDKSNIKVATNQSEFENLVALMNSSAKGGFIKIKAETSIIVNNITLKKTGIIGKGQLTADTISVIGEGYIGDGLELTVNDNITVDGSLILSVVTIQKPTKMGSIIKGLKDTSKIIIRASSLSGGKNIISGNTHLITINGGSAFSDYEKSAVDVKANFLNCIDTSFKNGEYGVYVGDITNLYLSNLSAINIQTPIYLSYDINTKVIDISDIDSTNDTQIATNTNYDSKLIDIAIGRLKKNGSYMDVTLVTPSAQYAYAYNGVTFIPATGETYQKMDQRTGGGNIYPYHIPIGYFPAEWNYLHPSEPFPRKN